MTADKNFRKHHRHGLFAGQISSRVPGPEGGFPGGEASTSPPSPAGHGGTAPRVSPAARAASAPRGSLLSAAALETRGGLGAPPAPHSARKVSRSAAPRGRTARAGPPSQHRAAPPPPRRRGQRRGGASRDWGRGWEGEGHLFHGPRGSGWSRGRRVRGGAKKRGTSAGWRGRAARSSDAPRGAEEGHEGTRVARSGRAGGAGAALPSPAGRAPKRRLKLVLAPPLTCAARGAAAIVGAPPPPPLLAAEEPAGKSAPYLEEGTDLVLLQVGLDPGLLVRRHEELTRRGLELLSPGGGCSPSGCSRLTPPPPKGCHSGSGGRCWEGAAARSRRDGANSGNRRG